MISTRQTTALDLSNIHRHTLQWLLRISGIAQPKTKLMKMEKSDRFATNIGNKGRLFRAAGAGGIGLAAMLLWTRSPALGVGLALAAAFLAFEAARGWCALRACGVKTKF